MSNDIIIEEFEDRRWMRSEVFQELMRVAEVKDLLHKDAECSECDIDANDEHCGFEADDDYWAEAMQHVVDCSKEELDCQMNYKEDEGKFSALALSLMKEAEVLLDEGNAAGAFEIEKKVWQIKHNLRKMKQIANSQLEE